MNKFCCAREPNRRRVNIVLGEKNDRKEYLAVQRCCCCFLFIFIFLVFCGCCYCCGVCIVNNKIWDWYWDRLGMCYHRGVVYVMTTNGIESKTTTRIFLLVLIRRGVFAMRHTVLLNLTHALTHPDFNIKIRVRISVRVSILLSVLTSAHYVRSWILLFFSFFRSHSLLLDNLFVIL